MLRRLCCRRCVRRVWQAKSLGSLTLGAVDRGVQYAYKFRKEDWRSSVSDTVWADLVQCIYQSVEYEDLGALSGVVSMFAGSGKKVSAGNGVLRYMVQYKSSRREGFVGYMTDQSDAEQGSGRELSDDEIDGASVKKGRRRSLRDCSATESSDGRMR